MSDKLINVFDVICKACLAIAVVLFTGVPEDTAPISVFFVYYGIIAVLVCIGIFGLKKLDKCKEQNSKHNEFIANRNKNKNTYNF